MTSNVSTTHFQILKNYFHLHFFIPTGRFRRNVQARMELPFAVEYEPVKVEPPSKVHTHHEPKEISTNNTNIASSSSSMYGNANRTMMSTEDICRSPYLMSSIYGLILVAFIPLMMIVFDNHTIMTYTVRMRMTAFVNFLLAITIITLFFDFGWLAIISYTLAECNYFVTFNKPPPFKVPRFLRYFGTSAMHHSMIFILFITVNSVDDLNTCEHARLYALLQASRVLVRILCVQAFLLNKNVLKNPMVSVFLNVIITINEVVFTTTMILMVGWILGMTQILFILVDIEFTLALNRQYKSFVSRTSKDDEEIAKFKSNAKLEA